MNSQRSADAARSLDVARRDLDTIIAPALSEAGAQSALAMVSKLLQMIAGELRDGAVSRAEDAAQSSWVQLPATVKAEAAGADESALARLEQAARHRSAATEHSPLWQAGDAIAAIYELRDTGISNAAWDSAYRESGGSSRKTEAVAAKHRGVTIEALNEYLRNRYPERNLLVRQLERLPGGFSKATYVADVLGGGGQQEQWALRCDLSFTPLQTHVVDEFPLLVALHSRGLPIPEPLWFEADAARVGSPVIALRKVGGTGDISKWGSDPAVGRSVALEAARLLASIHASDVATLPSLQTAAPGCTGATPADVVEHMAAFWRVHRLEANPLVELILQWLARNAPAAATRTLVHGDFGLHNLLVDGGRISAVLDWELAHIGDPREDLAYAKPFVEAALPWDEFMAAYEGAGGVRSDAASLRFYSVLGTLRNSLGCMRVQHSLHHDDPGVDSKLLYVGRSYAQQMLRGAARLTGML